MFTKEYRAAVAFAGSLIALAGCGGSGGPAPQDSKPIELALPARDGAEDTARPFVGVWAGEPGWCSVAPGADSGSPLAISETTITGFGRNCRINDVVEGTEGGYTLTLDCDPAGDTVAERIDIETGDGALTVYWPDGDPPARYLRCP